MQRNWIGRSEGSRIDFTLEPRADGRADSKSAVPCFTTRVDTIYGCTYRWFWRRNMPNCVKWLPGCPEEKAVLAYQDSVKTLTNIDRASETLEKTGTYSRDAM